MILSLFLSEAQMMEDNHIHHTLPWELAAPPTQESVREFKSAWEACAKDNLEHELNVLKPANSSMRYSNISYK